MKLSATLYDRVRSAAEAVTERLDTSGVEVAVILGSGLAAVADILDEQRSVPYARLPGWPETTVAGHPGRLATGRVGGKRVLIFCGRVHGYEGYPPEEVGFGVRVAATLGTSSLIVTNVSGGIDPTLTVGEIVALADHINLAGGSPLRGPNDERFGPRFVDLSDTYALHLRKVAAEVAPAALGHALREVVYAGMAGPHYETPAEVRMLRTLGANVVGMSTVHEVIVARHCGLPVLGLSMVANPACGVATSPLRHDDVTKAAASGSAKMGAFLRALIQALPAVPHS